MRYFLTINASRPYVADGYTFTFEPISNRGGSWLGVLAVDDQSAASALASAQLFGVEEIIQDRYDSLKKKVMVTLRESSALQRPRRVPTPGASAGAVRLVEPSGRTHGVGNPLIPRAAPEVAKVSVSLQSTDAQPPSEALLDMPSLKTGRRFSDKKRAV